MKANERIKNGSPSASAQAAHGDEGIHTVIKKAVEDNYTSSVYSKLMSGQELSSEEMAYLKEKNPELYRKAAKIKEERKVLSERLKKCKSKDEARKVKTNMTMNAMSSAPADAKAPDAQQQSDFVIMRIKAIENQFNKFANSLTYANLQENSKKKRVRTDTVQISDVITQKRLRNEYEILTKGAEKNKKKKNDFFSRMTHV